MQDKEADATGNLWNRTTKRVWCAGNVGSLTLPVG